MAQAGLVQQHEASSARRVPLEASALSQSLQQIAERLEVVLESERQLLTKSSFDDLVQVIARKDQLALEIARLGQHASGCRLDPDGQALLHRAERCINANARLLKNHIDAVGEIASLITAICSNADADGTYSVSVVHRRTGG